MSIQQTEFFQITKSTIIKATLELLKFQPLTKQRATTVCRPGQGTPSREETDTALQVLRVQNCKKKTSKASLGRSLTKQHLLTPGPAPFTIHRPPGSYVPGLMTKKISNEKEKIRPPPLDKFFTCPYSFSKQNVSKPKKKGPYLIVSITKALAVKFKTKKGYLAAPQTP